MPTQDHATLLNDLITMGMDLARRAHAGADPTPTPEQVATFDRAARCVRRTMLLARRLADPAPLTPAARRTAGRAALIRNVEDAIHREHADTEPGDRLRAEFAERLDAPELDDELLGRPLPDLIQDIRHDLGLDVAPGTRPWQRRTPAEIRELHRRAAAPPVTRRTPPSPLPHQPARTLAPSIPGTPPYRPDV